MVLIYEYCDYTLELVIKSFRHKGLETFFTTGKKSGIRPDHSKELQKQLAVLHNARSIVFEGSDVHLLHYLDHH